MKRFTSSKINLKVCMKFVLLALVSLLLLSATLGTGFITHVACEQTTNSDPVDPFPQAGKFYTLAGRTFNWASVGGKNVTTGHNEELLKWSVQDIVGDVVLVNRTMVIAYIQPETGENYTDTYDIDYEIAMNRTILSAHQKYMRFDTTGFQRASEYLLDEDIGEHTWAWFSTDLYIGAYVLVGWTYDNNFLGDMLYEVVGEEVIQVVGQKQDCWMLRMPPSVNIDGTHARTETYWVDKDTGVPLKVYEECWALDGSSGFALEDVLVHTNIDLGQESTQPASPTYTLTVPTTPGFPEAGKFYTQYLLDDGWYMKGVTNVTWYDEIQLSCWVINVTGNEAFVCKIFWDNWLCETEGMKELESVAIYYRFYNIDITTREIIDINGTLYAVNMTSLTYVGPLDYTPYLVCDIGEETDSWLPTDLYIGANVNISWPRDRPNSLDNATYTVIDETIISTLSEPQACWMLHLPPTLSIDGTWNYTETWFSDKDTGVPLKYCCKGEAVDGNSAYVETGNLIATNVDLGPQTYVFPVVADGQTFQVVVVTNSTIAIETFAFSQGNMKISYNVTGPSDTAGFCNVTIPMTLLRGTPWTVKIDTIAVTYTIADNGTHTFLYFNYNHSNHLVEITGTWVIPEFPPAIILPLLMALTMLAVVFAKKKAPKPKPKSPFFNPFSHSKKLQ